ncbi:uncharacterized protein [Littorina saxatilis]|uniref:uncharacterized protein n=1 Tax=Littorina saxatilis TaxID=31220 RepID=UPI0038B4AA63
MNSKPVRGKKSNRPRSRARGQHANRGRGVYFSTDTGFSEWGHFDFHRPFSANPRAQAFARLLTLEDATKGWFEQMNGPDAHAIHDHQWDGYEGYSPGQWFGQLHDHSSLSHHSDGYEGQSAALRFGPPHQRHRRNGYEGPPGTNRFDKRIGYEGPHNQGGRYEGYPPGQWFGELHDRPSRSHHRDGYEGQSTAQRFGPPHQRNGYEGPPGTNRFDQQPRHHPFPFHHGAADEEYDSYWRWHNWHWGFQGPQDDPGPPGFPGPAAGMDEGSQFPVRPCLNLYPPTNLERYDLFEKAWMCGETPNTRQYLAIYWLHFCDKDSDLHSPLFENDRNEHAEAHMMNHLLLLLSAVNREKLKSITIMQNSSPCSKCADRCRQALEGLKKESDVEVSIAFSSFHWVRRTSCRDEGHRHPHVDINKHQQNTRGLRALREAGFTVRTTCYDDWKRLCKALQVPLPVYKSTEQNYTMSARGEADVNMREDLANIMS